MPDMRGGVCSHRFLVLANHLSLERSSELPIKQKQTKTELWTMITSCCFLLFFYFLPFSSWLALLSLSATLQAHLKLVFPFEATPDLSFADEAI